MRKRAIAGLAGLAALAIATSAYAIEPGKWEATSRMTDIQLPPGMPPQAADMVRQIMGGDGQTSQTCMTLDDLGNSPRRMFDETNGECQLSDVEVSGGNIHAVAQCVNDDGAMNMTMDGTYTATTYEMTMLMQGDMGMGAMTLTFNETGRRLGECN